MNQLGSALVVAFLGVQVGLHVLMCTRVMKYTGVLGVTFLGAAEVRPTICFVFPMEWYRYRHLILPAFKLLV